MAERTSTVTSGGRVILRWEHDDGGRPHKGKGGDCAVRAIAIASGVSYGRVAALIDELAKRERRGKRKKSISSARTGVYVQTMHRLLVDQFGWEWTPTMTIGAGCKVHLRSDELPTGRLVVRVSHHYCAVVDGVLRDNHDCSRGGTRCVYGYWRRPADPGR